MYTKYKREKDLADYRKQKLTDAQPTPGFGAGGDGGGGGGASGGASGGVKLSPDEQKATARKIYSSLLDKGYNTNAAAGITGNLWHESGGFGGGAGDSGTAHGIAQWRGDRWTKMQEYAKSKGKDPNDLNTQVDYLDQELRTDYKSAYNLLQHASDVKTATGIFADQFEKPAGSGKGNFGGISGMSNRLNFASQVANFGGGAIGTKPVTARAITRAVTGPQASLGTAPPSVGTSAAYLGAPAPETQLGQDTVASADDEDQNQFASVDQQQDDDQDVQGAASGGLIKGYATGGAVEEPDFTGVDKGINTKFNPTFRKSLLNLQQRATAAGIKTKLISGVRTLDDQKELYANFLAGQAGKPLPFPKRGAVKVAAKPGTSPHEAGAAADLVAVNPKDQAKVDALAKEDKNLGLVAGDPGHYQLNTGGKGGAPDTMVASRGAIPPPPPDVPAEEDDTDTASTESASQPEEERSSNAQAMADATERGRQNQAYMNSEAQYGHQRLMQEGATNAASLDQEAAARSTPPPPAAAQAQPQEAEGAAVGGLIRRPGDADDDAPRWVPGSERDDMNAASPPAPPAALRYSGDAQNNWERYAKDRKAQQVNRGYAGGGSVRGYAPGGVVDATGYIAPDTASLSSATQALAPAVQAASQAQPAAPAITPAVTTATAAAPASTPAAPTPQSADNTQSQWYGPGGEPLTYPPGVFPYRTANLAASYDARGNLLDDGRGHMVYPRQSQQQQASTPPPIPQPTGTDRGSVWNPTTNQWEAGVGYTYDQNTKGWVPASGSNAAKQGYAGGGAVRGYADGGDVLDDDTDEAVSTAPAPVAAPAPAAPTPAPAQPTPTGDARTRAGAPGSTDVGAGPAPAPDQKPPPPPPNLVADALHDGLVHLTKMFGLDKLGAVQDPDAQARVQAFNNGAGAADGEAMHAVHRAVDPNHQMTQQELATASVAAVKSYYDAKGQPEAGAKAIGEIMQHQKAISAHFSATAAQAFQQGDVANGLKFLKASYDQVPDGQHIDAQIQQDGTVAYKLTDSHSGRVIHQGVANAQQLAKLAQIGSTGTPYVKAVATSAARAKTPTPPPRPADLGGAAPAVDAGPASSTAPAAAAPAPDAAPATPPVDDSQASAAPAGGSGAYLAQRQAALTSGVSPGAVDTGTRVAAADTVKSDASVDGAEAPKIAPAPPGKPAGLLSPGNIDLGHRPIAKTEDGRIATVRSMGIEEDGKQILIPTVVDGKIVSNAEAIKHYHDTGENLGKFDTVANANQYSQDLHRAQQEFYKSGGAPPDEAVDTGKKPIVPVPDTPIVTPKDSRVTPTKVPEPVIPDRLTKPVEPEVRKADQKDLPDVAPVTPKSVDSDYDLTPRKFDEPQPDPSTYFANFNRWKDKAKTTGDRKMLVTMYNQANAAYKNADQAWSQRKAEFETEEGKRLSSENEQAGRAQTRENTTSTEQFELDKGARKEVLDANQKAQERQDKLADEQAAQQAGLNKEEVSRIVKRNEDDRAAARAGDAEAQKRLDKTADDLVAQKRENDKRAQDQAIKQNQDAEAANAKAAEEEAKRQADVDKEYRGHTWENDKIAEAQFQKDKEAATIKPPNSDQQKAIDEQLSTAPKNGVSPLDQLYSSITDPETGQPYTDDKKRTKDLGANTINGVRELAGHLIHANGVTPDSAVDIASQLINYDPDQPDREFFKVAPKPDKAGNVLVKVPGYPTIKISPEMAEAADEMRDVVHKHLVKVVASKKVNDALAASKSNTRWGTVDEAVDTGISGAKGVGGSVYRALFPKQSTLPTPIYQPPRPDRAGPSFKLDKNNQIVPVDPKDVTVTPTKRETPKPTKPATRDIPAWIIKNGQMVPNPEYK